MYYPPSMMYYQENNTEKKLGDLVFILQPVQAIPFFFCGSNVL